MALSSLLTAQAEFLEDLCTLVIYANGRGFIVTSGELWRPTEMQELYVKTGRSKTMNSYHLKRLAGDLNFFSPDGTYIIDKKILQEIGNYWESLRPGKNFWGGNFSTFKDVPHFERRL